jgi:RimJ/RimL family protein N-acetyltransferase
LARCAALARVAEGREGLSAPLALSPKVFSAEKHRVGRGGTAAPTLTTKRLTLRPIQLEDFEPYAAMLATDRARWMGRDIDRTKAWAWFASDVAHWPLFGFGSLMIEVTATGETVGEVGLHKGIAFPETELGWMLFDGFEGQGYATEAALEMRRFAYEAVGLTSLVSYISAENARSRALAERMGAVVDPAAPAPDNLPTLVYRHPAPEAPR